MNGCTSQEKQYSIMYHLICFHLFNDFSGSPKVLTSVLSGLASRGYDIDLITSSGEGALSRLSEYGNVRLHTYRYRFSDNKLVTMVRYVWVQIYMFFFALRFHRDKDCVFYINTILPIGAALSGRIMGKKVVYHYHENAFVKGAFYRFLARCMQSLAYRIICVSEYQKSFLERKEGIKVVPNAIPSSFIAALKPDPEAAFARRRILMLGSLKGYKGTSEFTTLAKRLPQFSFEIVLNEDLQAVENYIDSNNLSSITNLSVFDRQENVIQFYNSASIVLNLTNKEQAIETFGLTALEAMSAGLPVIVPTVGGIAEIVEDGVNGYKIDVQDLDRIADCISRMLSDRQLYLRLAASALEVSRRYSEQAMVADIIKICFK